MVILVDLRSIHNFLDSSLVPRLKLPVDTSMNLYFKVSNGQCIKSGGHCKAVNLKVQGTKFLPSFYMLELAGCDVVLGVQWRKHRTHYLEFF